MYADNFACIISTIKLEQRFRVPKTASCLLQNNNASVVARFDLQKTWRELVIAVVVPTVMFIISSATLCIITRSVNVGDDTKMRCKYCVGSSDMGDENASFNRGATRNNTSECLLPRSEDNVRANSTLHI
jgi:hypothetical protein